MEAIGWIVGAIAGLVVGAILIKLILSNNTKEPEPEFELEVEEDVKTLCENKPVKACCRKKSFKLPANQYEGCRKEAVNTFDSVDLLHQVNNQMIIQSILNDVEAAGLNETIEERSEDQNSNQEDALQSSSIPESSYTPSSSSSSDYSSSSSSSSSYDSGSSSSSDYSSSSSSYDSGSSSCGSSDF